MGPSEQLPNNEVEIIDLTLDDDVEEVKKHSPANKPGNQSEINNSTGKTAPVPPVAATPGAQVQPNGMPSASPKLQTLEQRAQPPALFSPPSSSPQTKKDSAANTSARDDAQPQARQLAFPQVPPSSTLQKDVADKANTSKDVQHERQQAPAPIQGDDDKKPAKRQHISKGHRSTHKKKMAAITFAPIPEDPSSAAQQPPPTTNPSAPVPNDKDQPSSSAPGSIPNAKNKRKPAAAQAPPGEGQPQPATGAMTAVALSAEVQKLDKVLAEKNKEIEDARKLKEAMTARNQVLTARVSDLENSHKQDLQEAKRIADSKLEAKQQELDNVKAELCASNENLKQAKEESQRELDKEKKRVAAALGEAQTAAKKAEKEASKAKKAVKAQKLAEDERTKATHEASKLKEALDNAKSQVATAEAARKEAETAVTVANQKASTAIAAAQKDKEEALDKVAEAEKLLGLETADKEAAIARADDATELLSELQVDLDAAAECVEVAEKEAKDAKMELEKMLDDAEQQIKKVTDECQKMVDEIKSEMKQAEDSLEIEIKKKERIIKDCDIYKGKLRRRDDRIDQLEKELAVEKARNDRRGGRAEDHDRTPRGDRTSDDQQRNRHRQYLSNDRRPRDNSGQRRPGEDLRREGSRDTETRKLSYGKAPEEEKMDRSPENRDSRSPKGRADRTRHANGAVPAGRTGGDLREELNREGRKRAQPDGGRSGANIGEGSGQPQMKRPRDH